MDHTIEIEVVGHTSLGGVFDLGRVSSVDVGRSGGCTIVLDDPLIAAKHCRVVREHDRIMLKNLDQEIGVYCDGEFVERETVLSGEHEIDLGEVQLIARVRVEIAVEPPPAIEPAPAAHPENPDRPATARAEPDEADTSTEPDERQEPGVVEQDIRPEPVPEAEPVGRSAIAPPQSPTVAVPIPEPEPEPEPRPEPKLEPEPEPDPEPEASSVSLDDLPPASAGLAAPLADEFGVGVLGLDDPARFERFITRLGELSARYKVESDSDRRALLRCMVLIGDDLSESNRRNADIEATLGLVDRPAEQRLRRATKIAERIADEKGGPVGLGADKAPPPPRRSAPEPTRPPAPTPEPPEPFAAKPPKAAPPPAPALSEPDPPPAAVLQDSDAPSLPAEPRSSRVPAPSPASVPTTTPNPTTPNPATPSPPASRTPDPADPHAGSLPRVPGYEIESAEAGVFTARDAATGEHVIAAIAEGDAASARDRLARASGLIHRNLVKVLDTGVASLDGLERAFLIVADDTQTTLADVLERVSLKPMAAVEADEVLRSLGLSEGLLAPQISEIIAGGERVFERLVLTWIADLAEAMQLAHDSGLTHGGIGAASVLLDRHGLVVLRWLGRYDRDESPIDRISTDVLETLSPERVAAIADGEPLPAHALPGSDIWSLGLLGYSLLSGRSPFAASRGELLREIVTKSLREPHEMSEGVNETASGACMAALRRDPTERPPTMAAYAELLMQAAHGEGDAGGKKRFGLFGKKG